MTGKNRILTLIIISLMVLAGFNVNAAVITVTSNADTISDGDGCTFREAIINANENAATCPDCLAGTGNDTIVFDESLNGTPITMEIVGNDRAARSGDFDITAPVTIIGNGPENTIIQGGTDKTNGIDRIFHIYTTNASIEGLTIRNGRSADSYGGGVYFQSDPENTATFTNCVISDNTATSYGGGGFYNGEGTLNIISCTVSGNDGANYGGAIYNEYGKMSITDSTFRMNTASSTAGFMYNDYAPTIVNISGCTIENNTGRWSGGLHNENEGTVNLKNTTIRNNTASHYEGGGINNRSGNINITNCTVTGNSAGRTGGGIHHDGGTLTIIHSTIVYNTTDSNEDGRGDGGGIGVVDGTAIINNSIIALNTDKGGEAPNMSGIIISNDYNLIGDEIGYAITGTTDNNIITADPMILPLADNGGVTQTHALIKESPAVDSGGVSTVNTDQRGHNRPSGSDSDIGAFEFYFVEVSSLSSTGSNSDSSSSCFIGTLF